MSFYSLCLSCVLCVCVLCCYPVEPVCLSFRTLTFTILYISLLHSSVSRGRSCILIIFSLLIVDCFELCPMVVSLIEGFSTLNRALSILYKFVYFFDHCSLTFKLKHDTCYTLTLLYLSSGIRAKVVFLARFINGGQRINNGHCKWYKLSKMER